MILINLFDGQIVFYLLSVFAFRSLVMFPINSNFLHKMRPTKTAVQRANVFEMEHFLQNNECADSTV